MSRAPIIHRVSFARLIPLFVVGASLMCLGAYLDKDHGLLFGGIVFYLTALVLRMIPRDHRAGIRLSRKSKYLEAIPCFLRSFEFFQRYPWIDKYRSLVILSPSSISYSEMALLNTAFSYAQVGDGAAARKYYEKCLELFPNSAVASAALMLINIGESSSTRSATESLKQNTIDA